MRAVTHALPFWYFSSPTYPSVLEYRLSRRRAMTTSIADHITLPPRSSAQDCCGGTVLNDCQRMLSPAVGAAVLQSDFAKNVCLLAPEDDPLGQLARQLFHVRVTDPLTSQVIRARRPVIYLRNRRRDCCPRVCAHKRPLMPGDFVLTLYDRIAHHFNVAIDTVKSKLSELAATREARAKMLAALNSSLRAKEPKSETTQAGSQKSAREKRIQECQDLKDELHAIDARCDTLKAKIAHDKRTPCKR